MMKLLVPCKTLLSPRTYSGTVPLKRAYRPYRDLANFKPTSLGEQKTPQLQQYFQHLLRRSNTESEKEMPKPKSPFSLYGALRDMLGKK